MDEVDEADLFLADVSSRRNVMQRQRNKADAMRW